MASLIINADDLGIAPSIDEGILEAHRNGVVTSTTALATSPRFAEAAGRAHAQGLAVGLHLNLTLGTCASSPQDVPTLARANGEFHLTSRDLPRLLGGMRHDPALLDELQRELSAQFARAADIGVPFTHYDSHQHVHMIPAVFAVAAELAPRYGFTRTRLAREPLTRFHLAHRLADVARRNNIPKWLWLRLSARRIANPLASPNAFFGVLHSGIFGADTLIGLIRTLRPGAVAEIGIHPGHPASEAEATYPQPFSNAFLVSSRRSEELNALTDPRVRQAATEAGVRLISFADLGRVEAA